MTMTVSYQVGLLLYKQKVKKMRNPCGTDNRSKWSGEAATGCETVLLTRVSLQRNKDASDRASRNSNNMLLNKNNFIALEKSK